MDVYKGKYGLVIDGWLALWRWIAAYWAREGLMPTLGEMGAGLGYSASSVWLMVNHLEQLGVLERVGERRHRGLRLLWLPGDGATWAEALATGRRVREEERGEL